MPTPFAKAPDFVSAELAELGERKLVCRTSRKTLFWGFLLAFLVCSIAIAVLFVPFTIFKSPSTEDMLLNSAFFLPIGTLLLWGGIVLLRKANAMRHIQVVVHVGGLASYQDKNCLTCRWDQLDEVTWQVRNHYDEGTATVGGVPIYANSKHSTHRLTVRRKDGIELVFTDDLANLKALAKAIQMATGRRLDVE
jgi:hypothetical protein